MLRTLMALAKVDGRVSIFLEPIALYMTKDLYEAGRRAVAHAIPGARRGVTLGEGRVYGEGDDLVIISYGNGVPMSLRPPNASGGSRLEDACLSTCAG